MSFVKIPQGRLSLEVVITIWFINILGANLENKIHIVNINLYFFANFTTVSPNEKATCTNHCKKAT